jgi:hypothetical protein
VFTIVAGGALSYTYSSNGNTVSPANTATYSVVGTSSLGCVSANAAVSSITVHALPTVLITTSSPTICTGEIVVLTAGGATSYQWSGGQTTNSVNVTPAVTTNYTVTGTDNNGCVNIFSFTQVVDPCLGLSKNDFGGFKLYPNPTNGKIIVEINAKATLSVYNEMGQIITSYDLHEGANNIELFNAAKGMYFIKITQGASVKYVRVVKQ